VALQLLIGGLRMPITVPAVQIYTDLQRVAIDRFFTFHYSNCGLATCRHCGIYSRGMRLLATIRYARHTQDATLLAQLVTANCLSDNDRHAAQGDAWQFEVTRLGTLEIRTPCCNRNLYRHLDPGEPCPRCHLIPVPVPEEPEEPEDMNDDDDDEEADVVLPSSCDCDECRGHASRGRRSSAMERTELLSRVPVNERTNKAW
jgi:hypothetical protein